MHSFLGEAVFQKAWLDSRHSLSHVNETSGTSSAFHLKVGFLWFFAGNLLEDRLGEGKGIQSSEFDKMSISPALDGVGALPHPLFQEKAPFPFHSVCWLLMDHRKYILLKIAFN